MYGIETKPAKLAYKIGHVDASKIQVGDFLQAWDDDHGRGYQGRLFDLGRVPPTRYVVELFIPSHAAEKIEIFLTCDKCRRPPRSYSFFKFSNGLTGLSAWNDEQCDACSCRHEKLSGEALRIFEKYASWGRIP